MLKLPVAVVQALRLIVEVLHLEMLGQGLAVGDPVDECESQGLREYEGLLVPLKVPQSVSVGLPLDVPVEEARRDSVALGLSSALLDAEPQADALGVGRVLNVGQEVKDGELLRALLSVTLLLAHSVEETLALREGDT